MPTERKVQQVEELRERLSRCSIAIATDLTGLPVSAITELRQRLRARGIEYRVVKNTLAALAADAAGRPPVKELLRGPTALVLGYGDPVEVSRVLDEYIKSTRSTLVVREGVLGDRLLSRAQVAALASLPSREQLVAQLLGQLQAPLARLVAILNAPLQSLATLLHRRVEQLQGGGT